MRSCYCKAYIRCSPEKKRILFVPKLKAVARIQSRCRPSWLIHVEQLKLIPCHLAISCLPFHISSELMISNRLHCYSQIQCHCLENGKSQWIRRGLIFSWRWCEQCQFQIPNWNFTFGSLFLGATHRWHKFAQSVLALKCLVDSPSDSFEVGWRKLLLNLVRNIINPVDCQSFSL